MLSVNQKSIKKSCTEHKMHAKITFSQWRTHNGSGHATGCPVRGMAFGNGYLPAI